MDFYLSDEQNMIRKICSWIVDVVVALAFAWFCLMFFGTQVTVNGQSMYPLLNSGDVVLMNRLTYEIGKPDRMDVVVFEREDQKTNVKRVVAVPGDVVVDPQLQRLQQGGLAVIAPAHDEGHPPGDAHAGEFAPVGQVQGDGQAGRAAEGDGPLHG